MSTRFALWKAIGLSALAVAMPCGCFRVVSNTSSTSRSVQVGGYSFDYQGAKADRRLEGDIAPDVKQIEIRHRFGDVQVAPGSERMGWTWEVTCWAPTAEQAKEFAERVTLAVEEEADRMRWQVELPEPDPELRGIESRLTLHVPQDVAVDLANSMGESSIEGVRGGTVAKCEHGKLQLRELAGAIQASTSHGELIAEHITGATLTNEHGSLHASHVAGKLEAATSFAEIRVQSVSGTARLKNEHGAVVASDIGGKAEITTSHGTIEAKNIAGEIVAENEHGGIAVSSARKDVQLATSFGPVDVNDIGGKLHVRNEHGGISGRQVRGDIDAETSHAAIELDGDSPSIICRNEHGGIHLNVRSSSFRLVQAETSFGPLEVRVAAPTRPQIEAHADQGRVQSDYPVLHIQPGLDNFRDLDPAAPRMTLRNKHGSIRVINAVGNQPGT